MRDLKNPQGGSDFDRLLWESEPAKDREWRQTWSLGLLLLIAHYISPFSLLLLSLLLLSSLLLSLSLLLSWYLDYPAKSSWLQAPATKPGSRWSQLCIWRLFVRFYVWFEWIEECCWPQKLDRYWFLPPSTILGKGINPNFFVVEVVFMYLANANLQVFKSSTCLFSRDAKPCQQAADDEEGYQHDLTLEDLCRVHLSLIMLAQTYLNWLKRVIGK